MAIAHAGTTVDNPGTSFSSRTFAHAVSGTDRVLLVKVGFQNASSQTVSTVTHNGFALTKVADNQFTSGARVEIWQRVAPSTTGNVVVTMSASVTGGVIAASTYTGVDQTTPLGTAAEAQNNSSAPSVVATSAAGELVVDALCHRSSGAPASATVGAGQTSRHNDLSGSTTSHVRLVGSDEAGAASVTMSWSLTGTVNWATIAVPLKPASSALVLTATGFASSGAIGGDTLSGAAVPTTTYYVADAAGNDANAGTLAAPWKTIAKAIRTAGSGSQVLIRGGFYPQLNLSADTINKTPAGVTLQPYQDEEVVVTGAVTGDLQYVNFTGIAFVAPTTWGNDATSKTMQNCTFTNCIFDGLSAIGVNLVDVASAGGGTNVIYDGCWFRNARYNAGTEGTGGVALTFSGAQTTRPSNVTIKSSLFEQIEGSGIVFNQGFASATIQDNIFDTVGYGATLAQQRPVVIGVYDDSLNLTYRRNTAVGDNGRYLEMGVKTGTGPRVGFGTHSGVIVEDNLWFEATLDRAAAFVNAPGVHVVNNTVWSADTTTFGAVELTYKAGVTSNTPTTGAVLKNNILSRFDLKHTGGTVTFANRGYNLIATYAVNGTLTTPSDTGEIQTLPTFQNIAGFNYRLTNASAGVNAGDLDTTYVPATDRGGATRIVGGRVDMGAFESGVALSLSAVGFASDGVFGTSGLIAGTAIPVIAAFGVVSEEVIGTANISLAGGAPNPLPTEVPSVSKLPFGISQPDVPTHSVTARRIKA